MTWGCGLVRIGRQMQTVRFEHRQPRRVPNSADNWGKASAMALLQEATTQACRVTGGAHGRW